MTTIWKYVLQHTQTDLDLPRTAKMLTIQAQNNVPCLWVMLDPQEETIPRRVMIVGTGRTFDSTKMQYIATWQQGVFVFHAFEVIL